MACLLMRTVRRLGKTYSFRSAKSYLLPIILLVFASTAQRADALSTRLRRLTGFWITDCPVTIAILRHSKSALMVRLLPGSAVPSYCPPVLLCPFWMWPRSVPKGTAPAGSHSMASSEIGAIAERLPCNSVRTP